MNYISHPPPGITDRNMAPSFICNSHSSLSTCCKTRGILFRVIHPAGRRNVDRLGGLGQKIGSARESESVRVEG